MKILFSEMDAAASVIPVDLSCFEEKDGLPVEAFAKVQEIFNSVDWLSPKGDAALNVLQQITAATMMQEKLESSSPQGKETSPNSQPSTPFKAQDWEGATTLDDKSKSEFSSENQSQLSPKSSPRQYTSEQKGKEVSSAPETETLSLDTVPPMPPPSPTKDQVDSILEPPSPPPVPHEPLTPSLSDKVVTISIPSPPPPPTQASSPPVILSTDETTTASDPPPLHHAMQERTPMTWERDAGAKEGSAPTSPPPPLIPSPPTPSPGSFSPPTPIPSTQYSDDRSVLRSVPPPPPPPPPLTPTEKDNFASMSGECRFPCSPLSPLKEDSTSIGVPPPPPPPPHSTSLLKESTASVCRDFERPPPPPPPPSPLKGSISSIHGTPAPGPPPPLPATETASSKNSAVVPPPPPPPALSSSMQPHIAHPQNVPSAPPPPIPFINGETKAGTGVLHSEPMPPGPPPPSIPPPGIKGKALFSRAMSSINNQTKKLKPLHWLKLNRAVQGSLWAEAQKSGEAAKYAMYTV